jgi:putative ABC transport system ATP-binding protein
MPSSPAGSPATASDVVLEARGLHRFYERGDEEVAALRDVSFEVRAGEILAVMGPSGSGKSTLLGLLAGLDEPDGGNVWIKGRRTTHRSAHGGAVVRGCCIGVLTQQSGLIEHISVLDNVELAAAFRRRARRTRQAGDLGFDAAALGPYPPFSAAAVLDAVALGSRARARPSTLSGGETARANLAVGLAEHPLVLLSDEPTAEVSQEEEETLLEVLAAVRPPEGATIVVTHSDRVARVADRVIELVDGKQR